MRIATHRSINQASAAPLEKSSTPAGASFFEVLSGAGAQSTKSSTNAAATAPRFSLPADSDTGAAKDQTQAHAGSSSEDPSNIANEDRQTAFASADRKLASGKAASSQAQIRSDAKVSKLTEKPQTASSSSAANIAPLTASSPAQVAAAAVVSIPSPETPAPAELKSGAQSHSSTGKPTEVSDKGIDNQEASGATVTSIAAVPVAPVLSSEVQAPTEVPAQSGNKPAASGATIQSGQNKLLAPVQRSATQTSAADTDASAPTADGTQPAPAVAAAVSVAPAAAAAAISQGGAVLSNISLAQSIGPLSLPAGKTALNIGSTDATPGKTSDATPAADAKKSNPSQAGTATAGSSSMNISGSGQAATRPQGDASQAAPATPKPADAGAAQIQAIVSQGPVHEVSASHTRAEAAAAVPASHQPMQADATESVTSSGINTANLIQKMSESEMRVGMHSAEFGDISIRTSVSQQQMTAEISVDHGDLGKAIAAHIPAMEAKLGGELGLRALVEVNPGGMQFSGERGYSSQRDQRTLAPAVQTESTATSAEADHAGLRLAAAVDEYRLDIRA